ncbi:MAG: AraC family transcriptional regulator [Pseudomonadota bacterium]
MESSLEPILRSAVVGQQGLLIALLLFGHGRASARLSAAGLLFGVACYLLYSSTLLRAEFSSQELVLSLGAVTVPYALWCFAQVVFEMEWPSPVRVFAVALTALLCWVALEWTEPRSGTWHSAAFLVSHLLALLVVVHALLRVLMGRRDDLIDSRRQYRHVFVLLVSAQIVAVLIVELVLRADVPAWLQTTNVLVIAFMTLGLALPLFSLNRDLFAHPVQNPPDIADEVDASPVGGIIEDALLQAMADQVWREPGLTIAALAEQLGYPEHQVRRVINQRMGYRNFTAFLNAYRIPAAKTALADPAQVRVPILTIAMDLGYASIGPFNRAFKADTGQTPSAFRRSALSN